jgi:hypothetical protein
MPRRTDGRMAEGTGKPRPQYTAMQFLIYFFAFLQTR